VFAHGFGKLEIGAYVEVILDLPNTDVAIRGRLKHSGQDGLGIEFREIRKSDRQLTARYCVQQQQVEAAGPGKSQSELLISSRSAG